MKGGCEEMVTVYESNDGMDCDFFKTFMKDYGFDVEDASYGRTVGTKMTYPTTEYVLQVPQHQVERAQKFIADLRSSKVNESEMK